MHDGKVDIDLDLTGQETERLQVEMCYVGTNEHRQEQQQRGPIQSGQGRLLGGGGIYHAI